MMYCSIKCKPFNRLNLGHDMQLTVNRGLKFWRLNPNLVHDIKPYLNSGRNLNLVETFLDYFKIGTRC